MIDSGEGFCPSTAAQFMAIFPTLKDAEDLVVVLQGRGFIAAAIRVSEYARFDPTSFWYGKPSRRPQYEGWFQVFALDAGPYPSEDVEWWRVREQRIIEEFSVARGGVSEGYSEGAKETMLKGFNRTGLVFEDLNAGSKRVSSLNSDNL